MTPRFGIKTRNDNPLSLGGLSTQPKSATTTTSDDRSRFASGGTNTANIFQGPTNPSISNELLPGKPYLQSNPSVQILKPLIPIPKQKTYSTDTLNVSTTKIINGEYKPISKNGINSFRPEILSILDFLPIYTGDSASRIARFYLTKNTTPAGDLIDLQYQASVLRQETLVRLMQNIQKNVSKTNFIINPNLVSKLDIRKNLFFPVLNKNIFNTKVDQALKAGNSSNSQKNDKTIEIQKKVNEIRTEYDQTIKQLDSNISFLSNALDTINLIKKSLNIKEIPSNLYNQNFLSLDRFFEKKMQYNLKKFKSFADTKILLQLLFDFRSILESYSLSLLDLKDSDRTNDISPVKIDKTYTLTKAFSFNISNLRSTTKPINATDFNFFNSFVNSLPENSDDRIKILTTLISKEYRVSKGLGQENIQKNLKIKFNTEPSGNPFDNIIGDIGANIFEKPRGINSLSSLMFITNTDNSLILPFESKYVDSDDQKTVYIPGSSYFTDTIIDVANNNPAFNVKPYSDYVIKYNNVLNSARSIVEDIFDFDNPTSPLISTKINDTILNSIKNNLSTLIDINTIRNVNLNQIINSAIFKLANTDPRLKNLLFQYLCLAGVTLNKLFTRAEKKEIFKLLGDELVTTDSFSAAKSTGVSKKINDSDVAGNLVVILGLIAEQIEERVFALTSKISFNTAKNLDLTDMSGIRRPVLRSFTNDGLNTAVSRRVLTSNSFDVSTTTISSINNFTKVKIQKGQIYRALVNDTLNPTAGTTNFIQEFVKLSDSLQDAAVTQGTNAYLLTDGTNRTRYNFLSTSTQLLMIFEIFSSYINKYVYSTFERSNSLIEGSINIDNFGNKNVLYTINEILALPVMPITKNDIATKITKTNYIDFSTKNRLDLSFLQVGKPEGYKSGLDSRFTSLNTISINNSSQRNSSPTAYSSNLYNQVNKQIGDAFNSSQSFNDLMSSNYQEASSLVNIASNIIQNNLNLDLILSFKSHYAVTRNNLFSIRNKINDEEKTIANILHILFIVGTWLEQGSNYAVNFFNQNNLLSFLKNNNINSLDLIDNPSQIKNSVYILDSIKDKLPNKTYSSDTGEVYNNIIISDVIQPEENRALISLLGQSNFLLRNKADKKIKLLTVGIPSGFSKQLSDRVDLRNINQKTFKDKEFDIITINVFKRDARFDDLVFKPQKFIFDLSLYPREKDIINIKPNTLEAFSSLILRATVTDYSNIKNKQQISYMDIINNEKYSFLTNEDKRNIIVNHITSYLLATYINLLTGIRFYEDEFLETAYTQGTKLNNILTNLVFDYINNVLKIQIPQNVPIETLLKDPTLNSDVKDILTLISFGSFVFEPDYIRTSVLQPKLFDRIFTVPVDITKFEIDENLTLATDSGKLAYKSSYIQEKLNKVGNKIYLKENIEGLIFEDYFVTIEAGY